MVFALIGACFLVSLLVVAGLIPDPVPDAPSGGPPEFALGALFAVIAFLLPRAKPQIDLGRPVRIWRRGMALFIDWQVAGFSVAAVFGLSRLVLLSAGVPTVVNDPLFTAVSISIAASAFFCYFWLHPKFGRATLGQYIMGYRIEHDPDPNIPPHHFLRTVFATFAACSWHLWGWFVKYEDTQQGRYWWDKLGQTRAVFVGPY